MTTSMLFRMGAAVLTAGVFMTAGCGGLKSKKIDVSSWIVELTVEPSRDTYVPGERVWIDAKVYTADGALIGDPPLEWEALGAEDLEGGFFRLGDYESIAEVEACVFVNETSACGAVELPIDIQPPTLVVTSPDRAAHLVPEDGHVVVRGTIEDSNTRARLAVFVNGVRAEIASSGAFEVRTPVPFGIHHIEVEGTDGFHPSVFDRRDVLMADRFDPPIEGTTRFELDDAIVLRLSQKFFDRLLGGSVFNPNLRPIQATDLASMLELILLHLDLSSLFGDEPVLAIDDVLELSLGNVTVGDAMVDVSIVDQQGIRLALILNDIFVETSGWLNILGLEFDISGGLRVDVRGRLRLDLALNDGVFVSAVDVEEIGIAHIEPAFTGNDGYFFNELIDLGTVQRTFRDLVQEAVEGDLIHEFVTVIPEQIVELLNSGTAMLRDISFPIDTEMGPVVTLKLDSEIQSLTFKAGAESGYMDARLAAHIEAESDAGPMHGDAAGLPISYDVTDIPLTVVGAVQLAIRQDFLNGALHALWNAGLVDIDFDFSGLSGTIAAHLPPVLTMAPRNSTCEINGQRCDAILQIGQLELKIQNRKILLNLEAGAQVRLHDNVLYLGVVDTPSIVSWSDDGRTGGAINPELVATLVRTKVWPMVTELLGEDGGLSVPIPIPPPAELGLGAIAPGLQYAQLSLVSLGGLSIASGYLGLSVDLLFTVPSE